jgi:hypothetical protein
MLWYVKLQAPAVQLHASLQTASCGVIIRRCHHDPVTAPAVSSHHRNGSSCTSRVQEGRAAHQCRLPGATKHLPTLLLLLQVRPRRAAL